MERGGDRRTEERGVATAVFQRAREAVKRVTLRGLLEKDVVSFERKRGNERGGGRRTRRQKESSP